MFLRACTQCPHSSLSQLASTNLVDAWNLAMNSSAFLSTSRSPMYHSPSSSLGRTFLDGRRSCSYAGSSASRWYPPADPKQDRFPPISATKKYYLLVAFLLLLLVASWNTVVK
ncbi:hypothetical protein GUJ93_ZPchr0006g43684 [Zizania palustris]|uniref:Uncharacterized protein n=1 Tax=Zizania palustris TaxID=103762 RepID=A0A8J5ST70_ZIZPA|nr:hypothetical protein GUJ93_ZPchr0006g43684 [Zizania palustris]